MFKVKTMVRKQQVTCNRIIVICNLKKVKEGHIPHCRIHSTSLLLLKVRYGRILVENFEDALIYIYLIRR